MTAPQRAGRPPSPFPGLSGPKLAKIAKRAQTRPLLFSFPPPPFFPAAAAAFSNGFAAFGNGLLAAPIHRGAIF